MKKALLITFLTICIAMAGCGKQEVNEQEKIQISEENQEEKAGFLFCFIIKKINL